MTMLTSVGNSGRTTVCLNFEVVFSFDITTRNNIDCNQQYFVTSGEMILMNNTMLYHKQTTQRD